MTIKITSQTQTNYQYIATKEDGKFNAKAHIIEANNSKALKEVLELYKEYKRIDIYITPQSYKDYEKRTKESIAFLQKITIDIDIDFNYFKNISNSITEANIKLQGLKEYLVKELNDHVFNKTIDPSSLLDSGVGIHVRIDLANETNLKTYERISNYLANQIDKHIRSLELENIVKVDRSKLSANNFFRLEGTTNTKNGLKATIIQESSRIYTFEEILEDNLKEIETFVSVTEEKKKEADPFKTFNEAWTLETYAEGLAEDLKKVQSIYNYHNRANYRYNLLHIYANTIRINNHDTRTIYHKLNAFNEGFKNPLPYSEVNQVYSRIVRAEETERIPKHYIIKLFNITWNEQRRMKILVGQAIKNERKNQKEKEKRARLRREVEEFKIIRNRQTIDLHLEGFSIREISKELGISRSVVNRTVMAFKEA